MLAQRLRAMGPGLLVTAAFIGPGTVTTATKAGSQFGYSLLWPLVFAVVATLVLQEMASRLGLVARVGLGEAIRLTLRKPWGRWLAATLIIVAIALGNAAYQTGNLTGARLGMEALFQQQLEWRVALPGVDDSGASRAITLNFWPLVFAGAAFAFLWYGAYRLIERALIGMVLLMSAVFVVTACLVSHDWTAVFRGLLVPQVPAGGWMTMMALVGTTVVPYNLFLHASTVQEKWTSSTPIDQSLSESRTDSCLAISIGGLITLAIAMTAAGTLFGLGQELTADTMAQQLEPALGTSAARILFALGLTAAGFSSAITAPLAAAYATAGVLGWRRDLRSPAFRGVWISVLLSGTVLATLVMQSPAQVILIAQVAGGILLPLVAVFLLIVVNQPKLMRNHRNRILGNAAGIAVTLVALGLSATTFVRVWNALFASS